MLSIARLLPAIAALALLADAVPAQEKNAPVIGELMVQTIPAKSYVYGGIETDFKSMGKPIGETLGGLIKLAGENKLPLTGPVMHFYYGAPHTAPDKGFKMETGFFVQPGSKLSDDFKVRELPRYKCATILYVGPATRIGDAWQKLYKSVRDRGLTPTDEEREVYLYWEGVDSPNNIVQVMVGVK
ncbi:MAG: GyrI-like domain-containing protein [Planctomycetes bacterium]|nr:GyrI-like domain-containing protein [Planctomycetota bacterium]